MKIFHRFDGDTLYEDAAATMLGYDRDALRSMRVPDFDPASEEPDATPEPACFL